MYYRTDDPVADADRYFSEREERWLQSLPICSECGEPIQTEECYEINDELICPDCLEFNHRKRVEDYID